MFMHTNCLLRSLQYVLNNASFAWNNKMDRYIHDRTNCCALMTVYAECSLEAMPTQILSRCRHARRLQPAQNVALADSMFN